MWRTRKMTTWDAMNDLLHCRDPRAENAIKTLESLARREAEWDERIEQACVCRRLCLLQQPFRTHPAVEKWMEQYAPSSLSVSSRFRCLLLLGASMQGKTSYAMSLFGAENTLKVSCSACPAGVMPSLRDFDRARHQAIVFDELQVDQVLSNRELFQAGCHRITLAQSACGQHAYSLWLHGVRLIGCTNSFTLPEETPTYEADQEWLSKNIIIVQLPDGETWFRQET